MQENNFINVNTFMKKRVMMISSNKLISTEIKMKTFNEATITELRNDLKNAIKAIEENNIRDIFVNNKLTDYNTFYGYIARYVYYIKFKFTDLTLCLRDINDE